MNRTALACTALASLALLGSAAMITAGPLNPPAGPVASTYKTLSEVEPRIAINATNTPGDATSVFKITQPGSYYLTADPGLIPGGKHGILIAASNVTVDLNGFQLWSLGNIINALDGVSASAGTDHITVRNGITRNMNGDGIDLSLASECRVEDIHATNNNGNGISLGANSIIWGCVARQNGGGGVQCATNCVLDRCAAAGNAFIGIAGGAGSTLSRCSASGNSAGFSASPGSTLSDCSASGNLSRGFNLGSGCTAAHCAANSNAGDGFTAASGCSFLSCTAYFNAANGFYLVGSNDGGIVADCIATSNNADGIKCNAACIIRGNTCHFNGNAGDGAGIHATSDDNRIEGNNCTGADRGIDVDAPGNVIIRNTCSGNTTNWTIAANNVIGPILDRTAPGSAAISGNSAPSSLGSTDANANYTY